MITIHSSRPNQSSVMYQSDEPLSEKQLFGFSDRWCQIDTDIYLDDQEEFARIMKVCLENFISIEVWDTRVVSPEFRSVSLYFHISKYNLVVEEVLPK